MNRVADFFFKPASPLPLAVLRILVALTLLLQAFAMASPFYDFYLPNGVMQPLEHNGPLGTDGWLWAMAKLGLDASAALLVLGIFYVASLFAMALGWCSRTAVAAVWLFHALLTAGQPTYYGIDVFAQATLFLLLFAPVGDALSLDRGSLLPRQSSHARFVLRLVQLYLCIAYFACGVEKMLGPQWWNGEAIWRAMNLPTHALFDATWLSKVPLLAKLGCWFTLLVETAYPLFIWPRATRKLWVVLTISLHFGIAVFLGLPLFGLIMMVLTFSVWAIPAEPRAATARAESRLAVVAA